MSQGISIFDKWTAAEIDAAREKKLLSVSQQQTITLPDGTMHDVQVLSPGWAITSTHFFVQTLDCKWHRCTTQEMLEAGTTYIGFQGLLQ